MRLILLFLPLLLMAQMLEVGDKVTPLTLDDQFDKPYTIAHERIWVITWDKTTTRHANDFFVKQPLSKRAKEKVMIVDVSQTPEGILQMFVLPRMRSHEHPILLSYDAEYNIRLPYKEAHITVLHLDDGEIERIDFAEDERALAEVFRP